MPTRCPGVSVQTPLAATSYWRQTLAPLLKCVVASGAVLVMGAGCVNVSATHRGTLSKRCMQFQEDGDELVLENHLIDSREGSSGARGARGGGCGCN